MAENSKIEWTDHTFNPWVGCAKVSPGCKNCYAETLMDQRYGRVKWGVNGTRSRTAPGNWKQPLKWNRDAERDGVRRRVFCASLADVFEDRPDLEEWRADLFALIDATPFLDWLLLTKRPENIKRMWPQEADEDDGFVGMALAGGAYGAVQKRRSNVWLGTSVENQEAANERIPQLLKASHLCRFTFLSCEPLLGPVNTWSDANYPLQGGGTGSAFAWGRGINWVIVGGESGHGARPMHPAWARTLRDQCVATGTAFLFKQWGEYLPAGQTGDRSKMSATIVGDGCEWDRVGKHAAGRLLDGVERNGFPV
jgi:protein gp37